jgi:peptidoglycan/xylan/chitin deacetylase (PgdA/CDA1 family)
MKTYLFRLLQSLGVVSVMRLLDRNAVGILMMHGIMDLMKPKDWTPLRTPIPCQQLEASLKILSRHFQFVSLDDAVDMLAGNKPVKAHSMALTLDDGYRNQLDYAIPILKKFNAPATIFVVTENTQNRKPFWFDRLDYVLQHCESDGVDITVGESTIRFRSRTRAELQRSYDALRSAAKIQKILDSQMIAQMELLAERLEETCGRRLADIFEKDEWTALLTWEEIRKAARDKDIVFGSHSVNHRRIGLADEAEVLYQLEHSKKTIERHTGLECRYFCYPSGSFSRRAAHLVQTCGYRAAVTTLPGFNPKAADLFTLKRIHLPTDGNRQNLLWQILQISKLKNPLNMLISRQYPIEFIQGD